MLNHILFYWSVCLVIYCLNKWLLRLFIVWLNHLSEPFLAVLVEIAIKIIENLKYCLYHNIFLSPFIYSDWLLTNMLVCLSHGQLFPMAALLLFSFSSASEIWSQVHMADRFHLLHLFPSGPKNSLWTFGHSAKSFINISITCLTGVHFWDNFNYIVHESYQKTNIDESKLRDEETGFGILTCSLDKA